MAKMHKKCFNMNYMIEVAICFTFLFTQSTIGVNLEIDGNIDLDPEWKYELKPVHRTSGHADTEHKRKHLVSMLEVPPKKEHGMPEVVSKMIEKYVPRNEADDYMDNLFIEGIGSTNKELAKNIAPYNRIKEVQKINKKQREVINDSTVHKKVTKPVSLKDNMYVRSRKVKHDLQITEFTKHIYKQALKVFDAIKTKATNEKMKEEVDFLAQNYKEKFGDFVRRTQNQNIKTRLGRQKVIINTLETSNLILKRLVNYLVGMDKNLLRSEVAANFITNEVSKNMEIEKSHICKKFEICTSQDGFTVFTIDLITIVLTASDKQIKELADAFTEGMKYTDFSRIMDPSTQGHFQKGISDLESYDVSLLKAILYIVKNVMLNKNKPIEVVGQFDKRVNKTVGVLEMVDAFEKALPPNEQNRLEWKDIKNSLTEWKNGERKDIIEMTQAYIDHLKKGIDTFDDDTAMNYQRNLNLLLGSL